MLLSILPSIIDVASFILLLIGVVGLIIAIITTAIHANVLSTAQRYTISLKKVYGRCGKKILKRYLFIIFIAGSTMTICLLLRAILRGNSFQDYFLGPMLIYKITLVPSVWVISYLWPTKRKRHLAERKKRIKKASTF